MPKVFAAIEGLTVQIAGHGLATDMDPVEVPEAVATELMKGNRRGLLRIEQPAPPPRLKKKPSKEE